PDRRHLRDRGALRDDPGVRVQVPEEARVPDGADPSPLRDEGVFGDEDHGALLHRHRDPVRRRLRALLPLLLRPAMSDWAAWLRANGHAAEATGAAAEGLLAA